MADNLTIEISADSTKARVEIAKLQSSLRDLRKEQRELAAEQQRGRGDPAALTAVTRQIQTTEQEVVRLTAATRVMTRVNLEASKGFRALAVEAGKFAKEAGVPIEGLKAIRAGLLALAGVEVIRAFTDITDKMQKLGELSKQTRIDPRAFQVLRKSIEETGGSAEVADDALKGLSDTVREAQKSALEAGAQLSGPAVFRGGAHGADGISQGMHAAKDATKEAANEITSFGNSATEVFHGADRNLIQFKDNLKALHIDIKTLTFTNEGFLDEKSIQRIYKALVDLKRAGHVDEANLRSLEILHHSYNEIGTTLEKLVDDYAAVSKRTQFVTPEELAANERYKAQLNALSDAFDDLKKQLAVVAFPEVIAFFQDLTKGMKDSEDQIRELIGWVQSLWNSLKGLGSAIGNAISSGGGLGLAGAGGPGGFAAGGYIRGPGTGTSDSIAARLSNGEFVLNAGSVRRLGVGFLEGLNSFADGGFIGPAPMRFASGGLVSAGAAGGTPVHLHLNGHSFAMNAAPSVASALVHEAGREQLRSAGIKPSWYGGRPGS